MTTPNFIVPQSTILRLPLEFNAITSVSIIDHSGTALSARKRCIGLVSVRICRRHSRLSMSRASSTSVFAFFPSPNDD